MNFRPNLNMAAIGLLLSMAFFQNACTLAPTDYDAVSHDYKARHNLEVKAGVARLSVGFEKERSSMSVAMVGDLKIFFAEVKNLVIWQKIYKLIYKIILKIILNKLEN